MQGKTKIILFDCCRYPGDQNAPPPQMLDPSAETFISFSTKLNAGSWITEGKGCEFTDALASTLEAKARTHDVDSIFMEVRRAMAAGSNRDVLNTRANQAPPTINNLSCRVFLAED